MHTFRIYLRNGASFCVKADHCTLERNRLTDALVSYSFRGISANSPLYIDVSQIVAIVQEEEFECVQ